MAKRLIDAEKLKQRIIAFTTGLHADYLTIENIVMMINQADTVPAVEVVRCCQCKHFGRNAENDTYCSAMNGLSDPEPDDFSSYGERKEG